MKNLSCGITSGFNQAIYHGHTAVAKEIFEHWALDETSKEGTASLQSWLIQDTDYDSLRWAVSSGNPAMIALVFEWG